MSYLDMKELTFANHTDDESVDFDVEWQNLKYKTILMMRI